MLSVALPNHLTLDYHNYQFLLGIDEMRRIVVGVIGLVVVVFCLQTPEIYNGIAKFFKYFDEPKVVATIFTGILAISAVIYSQWRFDRRLEKQHQNDLEMKAEEIALNKKEEVLTICETICSYIEDLIKIKGHIVDNTRKEGEEISKEYLDSIEIGLSTNRKIQVNINKLQLLIPSYFPKTKTVFCEVMESFILYRDEVSYTLKIPHEVSLLFTLLEDKKITSLGQELADNIVDLQIAITQHKNQISDKIK